MNTRFRSIILFSLCLLGLGSHADPATTSDHSKEVIAYFTQWDAWKAGLHGFPAQGVCNQLNLDYSQYTILNWSFFGVAKDGSLHSADLRNKQIHLPGEVQEPGELVWSDTYSSWDMNLLYGEIQNISYLPDNLEALPDHEKYWAYRDYGYKGNGGTSWIHTSGRTGGYPLPLPLPGGAKGVLAKAHENGVKVMASIGGWSMCRHFPEMAADPTMRNRFLDDCEELIDMGFDGIDVDWEFPGFQGMNIEDYSTNDFHNFTLLMQAIRDRIGPDKLVTAAIHCMPSIHGNLEWSALDASMDYFNMMSYDIEGGWSTTAGHNSALYNYDGGRPSWNTTLQSLLAAGVPAHKINMGVGFYGRGVKCSQTAAMGAPTLKVSRYVAPDGQIQTAADVDHWGDWDGVPFYSAIQTALDDPSSGWTEYWDDTAKVPYALNGDYFISFDNEQSISNKAAFVSSQQLGGVIVWSVWQDLQFGPVTATYGKLPYVADVSAPLANTLNEVFKATEGLSLSILPAAFLEGDASNQTVAVQVTLSRPATNVVTVSYASSNITAIAGADYTAVSGSLSFAVGETQKSIPVVLLGDTDIEGDETFGITLSNPQNAQLFQASATFILIDNDTPAILTLLDTGKLEGNSGNTPLNFTLTLSRSAPGASVAFTTLAGTATADSDFVSQTGTVHFVGTETTKTLSIALLGDTEVEANETFRVRLSNPVGLTLQTTEATGTIQNDDTAAPPVDTDGWVTHTPPLSGVKIEFEATNPWSTGFNGEIRVINLSGADIATWTLEFDASWDFSGAPWNCTYIGKTNNTFTLSEPNWQGYSLAAGATEAIGFTGAGSVADISNVYFNGIEPIAGLGVSGGNTNAAKLYDEWVVFNSLQNTNRLDDVDGDGRPNFIEFLLGSDPEQADPAALHCGISNGFFTIEVNASALSAGAEYRLETSTNLLQTSWLGGTNVFNLQTTQTLSNGTVQAYWRDMQPLSSTNAQKFVRLIARDSNPYNGNGGTGGGTGGETPPPPPPPPPAGAPNNPTLSIQKDWGDSIGYTLSWNTWAGEAATQVIIHENGIPIYTNALTGVAPQSGEYDVNEARFGTYTYIIELSNDLGSALSAETPYTAGGASVLSITELDSERQAIQTTILQGTTNFTLTGTAPFSVAVNHSATLSASMSDQTLTLTGLTTGRSGLKITDANGNVRQLGIRICDAQGNPPDLPTYLGIGSVSEDAQDDLDFWADFHPDRRNKWVDFRYVYINGGVKRKGVGWRTWTNVDGFRVTSFVRESIKLGMIPVLVWYNIPDGGESYTGNLLHLNDLDYMKGYFEDLKFAIDLAKQEAGDELVLWILEPDFIGYMAQNSEDPQTLFAHTSAAYADDVQVLSTTDGDPQFPDTLRGLVEAINYTLQKHMPTARFGWQFNLWANPPGGWLAGSQIGVKGLMHVTDTKGMVAGRTTVYNEGLAVADYYIDCGILEHGAYFVSIDKYGLDAGAEGNSDTPQASTWFWNAEHWGNYLHYVSALHTRTGKDVVLWQLPVGHINTSQLQDPYHANALFPSHPNIPRDWEDSTPDFFFGDTFVPGAGDRYSWFSANRDAHCNITLDPDGQTITWGSHLQAARDAGVTIALFGDGVGNSTNGRGFNNTDDYWWITKTQDYYTNPVSLNP